VNTVTQVLNNSLTPQISDRLSKNFTRHLKERVIEFILMLAAFSAVLTTAAIMGILLYESYGFFEHVSITAFLTDTVWTPLFENPRYGMLP
jgi:phosphate transport system permease protein